MLRVIKYFAKSLKINGNNAISHTSSYDRIRVPIVDLYFTINMVVTIIKQQS